MSDDLYTETAYELARRLTFAYSTSFSTASKLFAPPVRRHIYAVYGMVRIADEIVDTYGGGDKEELLDSFNTDVHACIASGYSTNPIVHAFGATARECNINTDLIDPFFESMRTDLSATSFTQKEYTDYIYGSAEVIGLMCLRIFCGSDTDEYEALAPGARALGSAYQKVNFLRDFASDYKERGRIYFPGVTQENWSDTAKKAIERDIVHDFKAASPYLRRLPVSARRGVSLSYDYYSALLVRLNAMSAVELKSTRAHVSAFTKFSLFIMAPLGVWMR